MVKRIMREFRIDEISAVDRPAQAHAKMVIMKRADDEDEMTKAEEAEIVAYLARDYLDEIEKRDFTAEERRQAARSGAALPDGSFPVEDAEDLHDAMRAIGRAKDPEKVKAHIRSRAKSLGLTSELTPAFKRAKTVAGGSPADLGLENPMPLSIAKALGLPEDATEETILKEISRREDELETEKMTDDEKRHHEKLKDEDERKRFRAKSRDERKKEMDDRAEKERAEKAADPVLKMLSTENEDLRKRLIAIEEREEKAAFAKRAVDLGLPVAQGETLRKVFASSSDKDAVEGLFGLLGKAHAALDSSDLLKEYGTSLGGGAKSDDPHEQLMAKANELRKSDSKLTIEQAFAKVYTDPANADIAARERRANRPTAL